MRRMRPGFLRDNAFLLAAVALPLVVVGFFLLFTAVPRWTVAPPQYDLIFSTTEYAPLKPGVLVEFAVADESLQATVRPVVGNIHPPRTILWLFDHETSSVREIPVDLPELAASDPARTVTIDALAGRRVLAQPEAPDGYAVRSRNSHSPGIIGELFGIRRYERAISIAKSGRVVSIAPPPPDEYRTPAFIGWVVDGRER